ncbi:MAG: zinc-dependent alcohol dehydrogenase family protein [Nitrospinae bacterium]|nr:zinc-dependent alcohol dehydrogenase family protein [Nitrospinota bacterium]
MKAWVLRKPGPLEGNPLKLERLKLPVPLPGEVLIEVTACGVCRTDLHTVEGEIAAPVLPIGPGHQVVGRVVEAGTGTKTFKVGDRVGVAWLFATCGECAYCRRGNENLCAHARFTGLHRNGGYAEYMVARIEYVYKIPKSFDDAHAAPLLCAGIIGYRALKASGVKAGQRLGLFGFGASAHITLQVAAHQGAEVYVFSRSAEHRRHALALGATWAGTAEETAPAPLDGAISFTPAGAIIPAAMEKLDKGGTLALAGIYVDDIPAMDYEKHLFHEKKICSVTAFTREDAAGLLRAASRVPVKTDVEIFPFKDAPLALKKLKEGKINGAAVLGMA